MVITAIYEDKSTVVLDDDDYTIKPNRALKLGDESVMVLYTQEYEGRYLQQSLEVEITVEENTRELASHVLTPPADKLGYTEGDTLSVKLYRAPGMDEAIQEDRIDLSNVGESDYITINVTLRGAAAA